MTHRIVVNVVTGEQKIVDLTAEEITQAQAMKAAWDAKQSETMFSQTETINALIARIAALEAK